MILIMFWLIGTKELFDKQIKNLFDKQIKNLFDKSSVKQIPI